MVAVSTWGTGLMQEDLAKTRRRLDDLRNRFQQKVNAGWDPPGAAPAAQWRPAAEGSSPSHSPRRDSPAPASPPPGQSAPQPAAAQCAAPCRPCCCCSTPCGPHCCHRSAPPARPPSPTQPGAQGSAATRELYQRRRRELRRASRRVARWAQFREELLQRTRDARRAGDRHTETLLRAMQPMCEQRMAEYLDREASAQRALDTLGGPPQGGRRAPPDADDAAAIARFLRHARGKGPERDGRGRRASPGRSRSRSRTPSSAPSQLSGSSGSLAPAGRGPHRTRRRPSRRRRNGEAAAPAGAGLDATLPPSGAARGPDDAILAAVRALTPGAPVPQHRPPPTLPADRAEALQRGALPPAWLGAVHMLPPGATGATDAALLRHLQLQCGWLPRQPQSADPNAFYSQLWPQPGPPWQPGAAPPPHPGQYPWGGAGVAADGSQPQPQSPPPQHQQVQPPQGGPAAPAPGFAQGFHASMHCPDGRSQSGAPAVQHQPSMMAASFSRHSTGIAPMTTGPQSPMRPASILMPPTPSARPPSHCSGGVSPSHGPAQQPAGPPLSPDPGGLPDFAADPPSAPPRPPAPPPVAQAEQGWANLAARHREQLSALPPGECVLYVEHLVASLSKLPPDKAPRWTEPPPEEDRASAAERKRTVLDLLRTFKSNGKALEARLAKVDTTARARSVTELVRWYNGGAGAMASYEDHRYGDRCRRVLLPPHGEPTGRGRLQRAGLDSLTCDLLHAVLDLIEATTASLAAEQRLRSCGAFADALAPHWSQSDRDALAASLSRMAADPPQRARSEVAPSPSQKTAPEDDDGEEPPAGESPAVSASRHARSAPTRKQRLMGGDDDLAGMGIGGSLFGGAPFGGGLRLTGRGRRAQATTSRAKQMAMQADDDDFGD
eukprot:TRINITY_DN7334_c0_g1_i1.p1 TRINITY_DN7334_c0_g1~~TRINITY_DN7334_c0_g1_i1.p1  ORF type:complete len:893 (+),score=148.66 TRINITY_DN7334_c0_g1_i1:81-2759(+)